jgi:hypothetical protein
MGCDCVVRRTRVQARARVRAPVLRGKVRRAQRRRRRRIIAPAPSRPSTVAPVERSPRGWPVLHPPRASKGPDGVVDEASAPPSSRALGPPSAGPLASVGYVVPPSGHGGYVGVLMTRP